MIAFLHTTKVNVEKFEALVRQSDKEVEVKHFVNEGLLSSALKQGEADGTTFRQELANIEQLNPDLIVCTCSTYGEECEKNKSVERIDEPIARYIISKYQKIGLAYAAHSTKEVSRSLILRIAEEQQRSIEIIDCDCTAAWKYFEQQDMPAYELTVAKKIKEVEHEVEVIFLAQASMEGAKKHLKDLSKEVLTSPEYGVKHFLQRLS